MAEEFVFPDPVTLEGITEEKVGSGRLTGRARYSKNMRNQWSFRLKDGRYAYLDYVKTDEKKDPVVFYHILSIEDAEHLDCLDYWDRQEEKGDRKALDNTTYPRRSHAPESEGDSEDNPIVQSADKAVALEWAIEQAAAEDSSGDSTTGRPFPVKAEHAIIHAVVQKLSTEDKEVYDFLFNSYLTEKEIKKELELSDSAWSMRKARFFERVRSVFVALGYDVPTAEDLKIERHRYEQRLDAVAAHEEKQASERQLGRSIARELMLSESTTRSRAFFEQDQRLQADYEQMLADDEEENRQ